MTSEKRKIWEPLSTIGGHYWLEFVVDNRQFIKNGNRTTINRFIKFRLRNDKEAKKAIDITYDDIASYRITNESYSNNSIELVAADKERKYEQPWGFYTIEDSLFIKLIEDQTGIPATVYNFQHYYIVTIEDTIDIIASSEPRVETFVDGTLVATNVKE